MDPNVQTEAHANTAPAIWRPSEPIVSKDTSESRLDWLTGQWVIFSPGRRFRPCDLGVEVTKPALVDGCPFCQGNEDQTPSALWSARLDDDDRLQVLNDDSSDNPADDWAVRVVPNKYPAIQESGSRLRTGSTHAWQKQDVRWSGRNDQHVEVLGGHEVVVESARHVEHLSELRSAEAALVFQAWKRRILAWRSLAGIRHISVFKNVGRDAGASLQHSHSQLVALDQMPTTVRRQKDRMRRHHALTGSCWQCDVVRHEIKSAARIVAKTDELIAYCPFASPFAMSVRITTRQHLATFEGLENETLGKLARMTQQITRWLRRLNPSVAYNYLLHTYPNWGNEDTDAFHWALEIIPRTSHIAGLELGSGTMLNAVLPEVAAADYRRLARQEDPRSL